MSAARPIAGDGGSYTQAHEPVGNVASEPVATWGGTASHADFPVAPHPIATPQPRSVVENPSPVTGQGFGGLIGQGIGALFGSASPQSGEQRTIIESPTSASGNGVRYLGGTPGGDKRYTAPGNAEASPTQSSTNPIVVPAPTNTGAVSNPADTQGAINAAILSLLAGGGGGGQSPLDAANSPSTAALEAIRPSANGTSATSNPALIAVIVIAVAIAGYLIYRHQKKAKAPK